MKKLSALILFMFLCAHCIAQDHFEAHRHLFSKPNHYIANHTTVAPVIDGDVSDKIWNKAAWSDYFVDIEGNKKPAPEFKTRMKMLWNDSALFIAAELEEPHVWATLQNHDDTVYFDNDFEVFIDPDGNARDYYEIEVNAINTLFDLFLRKTYRAGGRADISWNLRNFKSAVNIQGTLNNPKDKDKGWTVEMSIPFYHLKNGNESVIPENGSIWRINFSRVNWDAEIKDNKYSRKRDKNGKLFPEHNWVWSPIGVIDMHWPERWGYLLFSKGTVGEKLADFPLPYQEKQKQYLWLIFYKQKHYYQANKQYASSLELLNIPGEININGNLNQLKMKSDSTGFSATVQSDSSAGWTIDHEGLIYTTKSNQ